MKKWLVPLLFFLPSLAVAQSVRYQSIALGPKGTPLSFQNVAVCTQPANTTTTPCSPLATLATSANTTSGGANPTTTDINGNFFFYAAPGVYTIQIYGPQIATPYVQPDISVGVAQGVATVTSLNKVVFADQQSGTTADAKVSSCIAALPSGGTCDARGFGAGNQTWAAQVTVPSLVSLKFDPATHFQPSGASVNALKFEPNSNIDGFTFDCGAVSYSGIVIQPDSSQQYGLGQSTTLSNITIDSACAAVTTGTAVSLPSTSVGSSIAFVNFNNFTVVGLANGVLINPSGSGFVSSNRFVGLQCTTTITCIHITGGGSNAIGNQFMAFSSEKLPSGTNAVLIDGAGGSIVDNVVIGTMFDFTHGVAITNTTAAHNLFIGYQDGTISDVNSLNTFIPLGSASSQPDAILQSAKVIGAIQVGSTSLTNLWESSAVPTIAGAGCGGSAASIPVNNGTAAFKINVGTAPGSACTVTMPTATTGWSCSATDITTNSTSVFLQKQTGAESTTSVIITNFSDVAAATAFVANDIVKVACSAD